MTIERFAFQRHCVAATTGLVLNIGANTDPAALKATFGARVINCDDRTYDPILQAPIPADRLFDCGAAWPCADDEAEMVVLGDVLEHLTPAQQLTCLREAHRVAAKLCITVPNDPRFLTTAPPEIPGANWHISVVDAPRLRQLLAETGWHIETWQTVDYGFVPEGYFVLASREAAAC